MNQFLLASDRLEILRRIECVCLELRSQAMNQNNDSDDDDDNPAPAINLTIKHPLKEHKTILTMHSRKGPGKSNITVGQLLRVLRSSYKAILSGESITLRALYYSNRDVFTKQTSSNLAVSLCSQLLCVRRPLMRVFATGRGVVFGPIKMHDHEGNFISTAATERSPHGVRIADGLAFTRGLSFETSSVPSLRPKFILVVEKESAFNKIVEEILQRKKEGKVVAPFVIVSGNGMPSLATREFLRVLVSHLNRRDNVPVLGLFDCNPDGMGVMLSYLYTSNSSIKSIGWVQSRSDYTIREMHWLGVTTRHVELEAKHRRLSGRDTWQIASGGHSKRDIARFRNLRLHPLLEDNDSVLREMDTMEEKGWKFEIDQLSYCGTILHLIENARTQREYFSIGGDVLE